MDENNNMEFNQQPMGQSAPMNNTTYVQLPPTEEVSSIGDWLLTFLIMCIPCVGLVMLFVWAFGGGTKKSKSNWAKAQLIWALICLVVGIICYAVIGAAVIEALNSMSY